MPAVPTLAHRTLPLLPSRRDQVSQRGAESGSTEACASTCMANTTEETCESSDSTCLCMSSIWQDSIVICLQGQCEAQQNLDTAYDQFVTFCNQSSSSFTLAEPSFTRTTATSSATSTSSGTSSQPTSINVSAMMAGVCTLFFVLGFIFGIIGVKDKLKHQKQMNEHDNVRTRENSRRVELKDDTGSKIQMVQMLSGVGSNNDTTSVQPDGDIEERLERLRLARLGRAEHAHAVQLETRDRRASRSSSAELTTISSELSPTSSFSSYHPNFQMSRSQSSLRYSSDFMEHSDRARDFCFDNKDNIHEHDRDENEGEGSNQHVSVPSTNLSSEPRPFLGSGEITPTRRNVFPGIQETERRDRVEENFSEFLHDEEEDEERLTWGGRLPANNRGSRW